MDTYLQIADAIKKDIEAIISKHEDCFYSPWAELRKEIFAAVDCHLIEPRKDYEQRPSETISRR